MKAILLWPIQPCCALFFPACPQSHSLKQGTLLAAALSIPHRTGESWEENTAHGAALVPKESLGKWEMLFANKMNGS